MAITPAATGQAASKCLAISPDNAPNSAIREKVRIPAIRVGIALAAAPPAGPGRAPLPTSRYHRTLQSRSGAPVQFGSATTVSVAPSVDRSPDTRRRTLTSDRGSQVTPSGSEATEEAPTTSPAARVPSPPRWPRGWPGSRSLSGPVVGAGAPCDFHRRAAGTLGSRVRTDLRCAKLRPSSWPPGTWAD